MNFKLAIGALALAVGLGAAAPAQAELSRGDVENIINEYLLNNPEVILKSVNDFQTKGVAEAQQKALDENSRQLFEDDMSPTFGKAEGSVRIVEFFDYNCGYCKRVADAVSQVMEKQENIQFIFKEYPILGPTSETAARWALAAEKQGKYVKYHEALLGASERVSEDLLVSIAEDLDLDVDQMRKDADSEAVTKQINDNRALAQSLNINGTPAFVIEDEIFPGAIPYETMVEAIESKREG